jgi:endonuclease/exonuclease/phosphatase family metal-dependent hydrolase
MKIISLNTWGGRVFDGIKKFFSEHQDIDVFCLQEVYNKAYGLEKNPEYQNDMLDFFNEIKEYIPNHIGIFNAQIEEHYGLALFIKNNISLLDQGEIFVHQYKGFVPEGDLGFHSRNLQYISVESGQQKITIMNFHGLWNGQGKTDTPDRIAQSQKIIDFCNTLDGEYVLCGDFNLLPETESLKMIEQTGLINLIKKYNITSTRTSIYTKPDKYADYVLVSPNIEVIDFKVLPDEVSDHAPLYLEIK